LNLWWRDDDAGADDPRLGQLLTIVNHRKVPIVLAVIPDRLEPRATDRILSCSYASVAQHGLAHVDHRSEDGRKCELVDHLNQDARLVAARERLEATFGDRFRPVMVPPWNRIEPILRSRLPDIGFAGLSTFASRRLPPSVAGLQIVDTHVDAIDWRDNKRPLAADAIVDRLRQAGSAASTPRGLLTHHAVTDEAGFQALDRAIGLLQDRHEAKFQSGNDLFAG
jgi:peptidoglycan/xylan/chitin deacetylase (PgdA/CDA1 family)